MTIGSARTDQATAELDRELMANTSLRVLYVYNREFNTTDTISALRPYSAYNIPITRRDLGPDGILNNADDGGRVAIYDYDPAYRGATFVGNMRVDRSGADSYNTLEVTFNKRNSSRWKGLTSFSATRNHRRIAAASGQLQTPNDDQFAIDETWDWVYKAVGNYRLPADVMASGVFDLVSTRHEPAPPRSPRRSFHPRRLHGRARCANISAPCRCRPTSIWRGTHDIQDREDLAQIVAAISGGTDCRGAGSGARS